MPGRRQPNGKKVAKRNKDSDTSSDVSSSDSDESKEFEKVDAREESKNKSSHGSKPSSSQKGSSRPGKKTTGARVPPRGSNRMKSGIGKRPLRGGRRKGADSSDDDSSGTLSSLASSENPNKSSNASGVKSGRSRRIPQKKPRANESRNMQKARKVSEEDTEEESEEEKEEERKEEQKQEQKKQPPPMIKKEKSSQGSVNQQPKKAEETLKQRLEPLKLMLTRFKELIGASLQSKNSDSNGEELGKIEQALTSLSDVNTEKMAKLEMSANLFSDAPSEADVQSTIQKIKDMQIPGGQPSEFIQEVEHFLDLHQANRFSEVEVVLGEFKSYSLLEFHIGKWES